MPTGSAWGLPVIRGLIERRILVNYHVDPGVVAGMLPAPFRPKLAHGRAMVGICLIRLRHIRLQGLPAWLGISSENAAHRVAVAWDDNGIVKEGVYVRRRDTSSRLNAWAGGRVFPGIHSHARFDVQESNDSYQVALVSDDGETSVSVAGHRTNQLPESTLFRSLNEASAFFQAGSLGYSATSEPARFQGLELRCTEWQVEPLAVEAVRSSFFDDTSIFPADSIEFDCALLMRNINHQWHGRADLCC